MRFKIFMKTILVIVVAMPFLLAGKAAAQDSTVIKTTADSYTFDRTSGNQNITNYGTETSLNAKFGGGTAIETSSTAKNYNRRTYLRFPTAGINTSSTISKVYVRLRYFQRDNYYSYNGTMISSTDDSWGESTITWDNQPARIDSINRTLNDSQSDNPVNSVPANDADITNRTYYFYLDVTDYVNNLISGGTLPFNLDFLLQGICDQQAAGSSYSTSAPGNTGREFLSKEFTNAASETVDSLAPSLIVYYNNTVTSNNTNYYVSSSSGNDANDGLSPATPWKTLTKVSSTTFSPGDSILFKAGDSWSGSLSPLGSGSDGSPIIADMYGSGNKPVINGTGTDQSAAFSLNNQSYWEVNNLEFTNEQLAGGTARLTGMYVNTSDGTVGITHIYIQNCYVHDVGSLTDESNSNFSKGTGGIIFTGLTNNVLIKGCHVKDVSVEGIRNSASTECSHFVVDSNLIENVYGDGIVLHGVKDGSAITHNIARNVCYNTSSANYAGIWTYLSDGTTVAYNEVSGITGGGVYDGEPFDADISTNGDIFEYNYTHDNKRGFMLFMPSAKNITVRYNISVNDIGDGVRLFNYTNITDNSNNRIYNNVFYITGDVAQLFQNTGSGSISFTGDFSNNIVYCTGTVTNFGTKATSAASTFYNNCFYPQSMTNVNGPNGTVSGNIYTDPLFVNAGYHSDGIHNGEETAYSLSNGSPCINTGYVVLNNGGSDYAGTNINNSVYATIGAVWPTAITTWDITPIKVSEDTYTYDGSASSNYGTASSLVSKFGGGYAPEGTATSNGYSRRTYLKFGTAQLKAASNIGKVYLRMRYYTKDNNYSVNGIMVSLSQLSTWSETGLNWNSQDADAGVLDSLGYTLDDGHPKSTPPSPITDSYINASTYYVYLDVTDTITKMIANNTLPNDLSFVLQGICTSIAGGNSPVGNTGYTYFSKEFTNTSGAAVDSLAPTLLIYSPSAALPVKSSTLIAQPINNNSVQLSWNTYNEVNANHFIIEKSSDGINFVKIGETKAAGTPNHYSFTDSNPYSGTNYYRWEEIDLDGKTSTVSNIASVSLTAANNHIKIYPVPVKTGSLLTIQIDNSNNTGTLNIRLINMQGIVVRSIAENPTAKGLHTISINTTGINKGVYFVSVTGANIKEMKKIIVE